MDLTERELEVLAHVAQGDRNKEDRCPITGFRKHRQGASRKHILEAGR